MKVKYVILKRCVNCGMNNSLKRMSCTNCSGLFTDEMEHEDWVTWCSELSQKAKYNEN